LLATLAARSFDGVLTLEVFDAAELESSRAVLAQIWSELGLGRARFAPTPVPEGTS